MSFQRIAVIYNPTSGRPRERQTAVETMAKYLSDAGKHVEILPTDHPNHATTLAREAVERGCDLVVANGGDGTMNEVLQALVGTPAALGFWPGGTANVLASEIHFPTRIPDVAARILAGNVMPVTVGKANDRYFLLMVGIGLDAAVADAVDPELKKRMGKAAFALAALQYVRQWPMEPFHIELPDGETFAGYFAVAGNGHSYGGGFRLTPEANLKDPNLDLCIFTSDQRVDYFRFALAAWAGTHRKLPGVIYRKVPGLRITGPEGARIPFQVDGEVVGTLPLTLTTVPDGVRLLV